MTPSHEFSPAVSAASYSQHYVNDPVFEATTDLGSVDVRERFLRFAPLCECSVRTTWKRRLCHIGRNTNGAPTVWTALLLGFELVSL